MAKKEEKKKEAKVTPEKVAEVAMSELKKKAYPFKVSKIVVNPARKIALENYGNVTLQAGMEIVFDEPQDIDSEVITDAFIQVRGKLQKEFREQMNAFGKKKETPKTE